MSIEWKYKIDLAENAIATMSEKYGLNIPDDLVKFLETANAATPSRTKFMVKVDEKILGAVLSFNPDEKEADSFESAMNIGFEKCMIPFAIDPFGNYICYDTDNHAIVFLDHENGTSVTVAESLKKFIEMLYV